MRLSKKMIAVMTAVAMMTSLTACGGSDSGEKKYHIGVCQLTEHEALDAATKGFQETLTKKLGEDKVEFDVQNAQGESTNCSTISNGFVTNNVDLIMANATFSLQAAASATNSIPIVGTCITDYASALNITDWSGKTGSNVTGVSDLAPIDQQEDLILEVMPNVKKIGIAYCSSEPNSAYQAHAMEEELKKDNIEFKEYTAADSNEIQSVITKACDENDALYIPTDNTMASSIETIKNVVIPAGIPVFAGEKGICAAGVATLSIDYYELGCKAADIAYDILVNKKNAGDIEVQSVTNVSKLYNKENCEALNVTVPDGFKEYTE